MLHKMDAYWRAANYLSVGQIYFYDNRRGDERALGNRCVGRVRIHRVNACSSCALFIDDRPFNPRCRASLRS